MTEEQLNLLLLYINNKIEYSQVHTAVRRNELVDEAVAIIEKLEQSCRRAK